MKKSPEEKHRMVHQSFQLAFSPLLAAAMATAACIVPLPTQAAGFSLLEQTGSGIGYAYAGAAASSDDASAMFFNPAALALLDSPQLTAVLHGINLQAEFQDRGSTLPLAGLGTLPLGDTRSDAGDLVPVPNVYLAWPASTRLRFGVGVNAPFGLITEYDDPWIGRFHGIHSELTTINVNPALGFKVNDALSLGAGVNYQLADAELSNAVLLGAGLEGRAVLEVDDEAWGWNVGTIVTLPSATRIGLSYRSQLDYSLTGDTRVTTLAGAPITAASGPTVVDVTFPDSVNLSATQPLGAAFELRADVMWMNWSEVGTILALDPATGLARDVLEFGFEDTVRVAVGLDYERNERWSLRAGMAWDESPVTDAVRTVRLPDADRWWLTVGARWRPTRTLVADAGYARIFVEEPEINLIRAQVGAPDTFASTVNGEYDSSVGIYSLQFSWAFR